MRRAILAASLGIAAVVFLFVPCTIRVLGTSATCGHLGAVSALAQQSSDDSIDRSLADECHSLGASHTEIAAGIAVIGLVVSRFVGRGSNGPRGSDELLSLRAWVARAREIHGPQPDRSCGTCRTAWPCPTALALGAQPPNPGPWT